MIKIPRNYKIFLINYINLLFLLNRAGACRDGATDGSDGARCDGEWSGPCVLQGDVANSEKTEKVLKVMLSAAFAEDCLRKPIVRLLRGTRHQCEMPGRTGSTSRCIRTYLMVW